MKNFMIEETKVDSQELAKKIDELRECSSTCNGIHIPITEKTHEEIVVSYSKSNHWVQSPIVISSNKDKVLTTYRFQRAKAYVYDRGDGAGLLFVDRRIGSKFRYHIVKKLLELKGPLNTYIKKQEDVDLSVLSRCGELYARYCAHGKGHFGHWVKNN